MTTIAEDAVKNQAQSHPGGDRNSLPRISLVTAVYNGERFLEDTFRSVFSQGYPNLEYIVVNDGSTDGTLEIIREYGQYITHVIDQPNQGLYSALNVGFAKSTGEIIGWLNCSDMLHTRGLFVVGSVFAAFPSVEWITGRPTGFNESGMPYIVGQLPHWSRLRFLAGACRHIQQESTYWRRGLWERAGGTMSTEYCVEGDFELWVRFFRHARLYTVDALIAGWRNHADSLSHSNMKRYDGNCDAIIDRELASMRDSGESVLFCKVIDPLKRTRFLRGIWSRLGIRALYKWPASDWPPVIEYRQNHWKMRP